MAMLLLCAPFLVAIFPAFSISLVGMMLYTPCQLLRLCAYGFLLLLIQVPCLTYGMRGMIAAAVEVKGPARDLHSGNDGGKRTSHKEHQQKE